MGKRKFVVCNAVMAVSDLIVLNNVPAQDISIQGERINSVHRQGEGSQREHCFPVHAGQLDEQLVQQNRRHQAQPCEKWTAPCETRLSPNPSGLLALATKDRSWRSSAGLPHKDCVLNAADVDPRSRPTDGVRL
jgi:hypothetical protein